MKISWQKKWEKLKLNSASYIIACNFLHTMNMVMLFVNPRYRSKWATRLYAIFEIWPTTDVLLVFIFSVQTLF